jgi:hypothetical protein
MSVKQDLVETQATAGDVTMSRRALMVFWIVMGTGCSATTSIMSSKAPDFRDRLTDMFVISQVGSREEISADLFKTELEQRARGCGIRLGVSNVSPVELDPEIHLVRMKSFGARYLLTLAAAGGTRNNRTITQATYDARLYEGPTRMVWRANVRLTLGAEGLPDRGSAVLAHQLLAKLSADGVTRWCAGLVKAGDGQDLRERRLH